MAQVIPSKEWSSVAMILTRMKIISLRVLLGDRAPVHKMMTQNLMKICLKMLMMIFKMLKKEKMAPTVISTTISLYKKVNK